MSLLCSSIIKSNTTILPYCGTNYYSDFSSIFNQYYRNYRSISDEKTIKANFRPYDYNRYGNNAYKIKELDPLMQEKTMMLLDYAKSQGLKVTITSGYRSKAEQAMLLRTNKYAAKNSRHCLGKAIDIRIEGRKDEDYKKLGAYAKSIGMRWGGDFKNPAREPWHFDIG